MTLNETVTAPGSSPPLTADGFLGGRLSILQPEKGYRAGVDSVLLAAAVSCRPGQHVFEVGIGAGVCALCVASRVDGVCLTGIELSPFYAELARRNAARNGFKDRVSVITGDVTEISSGELMAHAPEGGYDHVFANPPFFDPASASPSPLGMRAAARSSSREQLAVWFRIMGQILKPRGLLTVIHRSEALPWLLQRLDGPFGAIRVAPVFPRRGRAASRVVVQATRAGKGPFALADGLVLHGDDRNGAFTSGADAILRDGASWPLGVAV